MARRINGKAIGAYYGSYFRNQSERNRKERQREERNWRMYSGLDHGQWDFEALQQLIEEHRPPHQVNFIQNKIDTLLGNFLQNPFDTTFESEVGMGNDASLLLQGLYLADKNRGFWEKGKRQFIRAGLIYRGIFEFFKDYRTDPQGRIGGRAGNPFRYMFDADWETDDINDNKIIWQYSWMDPEQIKFTFNKHVDEIDIAVEQWKQQKDARDEDQDLNLTADRRPEFSNMENGRYLVIQAMELERKVEQQLIDQDTLETLPQMSRENTQMMLNISGSRLKAVPNVVTTVKVVTTVPGLKYDLALEDGEHPLQIGRYPLFTWSAKNLNGRPHTPVDILADLQEQFNKNESSFTHWQTTATNGVEFIEEDFFVNNGEFERYQREGNIPGSKFLTNSGKLSQERAGIIGKPRDSAPNDFLVTADRKMQQGDTISATPPVISGGEGKSGESAKLFQEKKQQALTSQVPTTLDLQDKEAEMGEAYVYMVKQIYSGAPRKIKNIKTGTQLSLNMPTAEGPIINDVSQIPPHSVVITQGKSSVTVKSSLLDKYQEILGAIQNPLLHSYYEGKLNSVLPNIPDSDLEESKVLSDSFIELQVLRIEAEKAQLKQVVQPQQQQALAGPGGVPGQTPAEGGGLSVDANKIPPEGGVPVDTNKVNQLR